MGNNTASYFDNAADKGIIWGRMLGGEVVVGGGGVMVPLTIKSLVVVSKGCLPEATVVVVVAPLSG